MRPHNGVFMRFLFAFILIIVLSSMPVFAVNAQSAETIWLQANTTAYKTGETVIVTVNGNTATPIQGFTTQIRYDPACLQPTNSTSAISGMNGLSVPQVSGLVDASFASTTPQIANGVLAEVRFTALQGCQTNLILESAALVIRNESGFAVPLAGVTISGNVITLNIDTAVGVPQPTQALTGSTLPLDPTLPPASQPNYSLWVIGLFTALFVAGFGFILYKWLQMAMGETPKASKSSGVTAVHFKHGPYAGKSFALRKLPCFIGRDPRNDLCLNDPHILGQHAKIYTENNGYYLMDLGGETFVNGLPVRRNSAILRPGDVVRLGKSALFVFGS